MANKTFKSLTPQGLDTTYKVPATAPEYAATNTYAVGDLAVYQGVLYKCTTAIDTPEAWTVQHWQDTTIGDEVSDLKESFAQITQENTAYTLRRKTDTGVTILQNQYIKSDGSVASSTGYEAVIYPITEKSLCYPYIRTTWKNFAVFNSSTPSTASFVTYISSSSDQFPTSSNPYTADAGLYIALSYRPQGDSTKYCSLYQAPLGNYKLKSTLPLTDAMKSEVNKKRPFYNFEKIESVIGASHMGYHSNAPENTIPAFRLSKRNGFDMVECDIDFTSDNIPVLMHDSTINRTCCNASDGSEITDTIYVGNVTYTDLQNYDACTPDKWSAYKGTKIPKFEELLSLCKCLGLYIYIDCKNLTDAAKIQILIDIVNYYGMKYSVIFGFNSIEGVSAAVSCDDTIYVSSYEGTLATSYITQLSALLSGNNKIAFFAYTVASERITDCINAGLTVGFIAPSSNETQALDSMDKRVKFVTGNTNATQYLYNQNIGDTATGLVT